MAGHRTRQTVATAQKRNRAALSPAFRRLTAAVPAELNLPFGYGEVAEQNRPTEPALTLLRDHRR